MSIQDDIFDIEAELDGELLKAFNRVVGWAGRMEAENDTLHTCGRLPVSIFDTIKIDDDGVYAVLNYKGCFRAALLTKHHMFVRWLGRKCRVFENSARHAH